MKIPLYSQLGFVTILLISKILFAQDVPITTNVTAPEKFSNVRDTIIAKIKSGELVSFAVALTKNGKIIWEESFGWADKENEIHATPNTIYPLGSLAKSITATGMMKLVNDRKISLTDDAKKYLSPIKFKSLVEEDSHPSVVDILSMTAGIPHGWIVYNDKKYIPQTEAEKDTFFSQLALCAFPPGDVFEYSNNSSGFVERLIEKVSGQSIEKYMSENVFGPLGMKNTLARYNPDLSENIAASYSSKNNMLEASYFLPTGGGGFFSSAHDLALYGMFHLQNSLPNQEKIITDDLLDKMHYYKEEPSEIFSLGWFGDKNQLISNGSISGANSNISLLPQEDIVVVCLTNKSSYMADKFSGDIIEVLKPGSNAEGEKAREEYFSKYEKLYDSDARLLGSWTGIVEGDFGNIPINIVFDDSGKVSVKINNGEAEQIVRSKFNLFDIFQGSFNGFIKTKFSRDEDLQRITIKLKLKDDLLYGYLSIIFGYDDASFSLPYLVKLNRIGRN